MADTEDEKKEEKKQASRKVNLHRVEIPEEMKEDAILHADNAMDKHDIEKVRSMKRDNNLSVGCRDGAEEIF